MALFDVKNLSISFGGLRAVDGFEMQIEKGELYGLIGPNGAGKSTTILMMLGLTDPTSGTVHVCGTNSTTYPVEVRKKVGYLPEDVGFYDDMTGPENLLYTARLNNIPEQEARQHAGCRKGRQKIYAGCHAEGDAGIRSKHSWLAPPFADIVIFLPDAAADTVLHPGLYLFNNAGYQRSAQKQQNCLRHTEGQL